MHYYTPVNLDRYPRPAEAPPAWEPMPANLRVGLWACAFAAAVAVVIVWAVR